VCARARMAVEMAAHIGALCCLRSALYSLGLFHCLRSEEGEEGGEESLSRGRHRTRVHTRQDRHLRMKEKGIHG